MVAMNLMLITVAIAAWTDWGQRRIPNSLLICSALAALFLAGLSTANIGLSESLLGGCVGLLLFLPFYAMRGMAAGDVKLLGVLGMYVGAKAVVEIALISAFVGGVWAGVLVLRRRWCNPSTVGTGSVGQAKYPTNNATGFAREKIQPQTLRVGSRVDIPYAVVMAIGALLARLAS